MDPTLFAQASTITFLFAWSSPYNDLLQQSARKNEPDRNFFSSDTSYLTDRPDAAPEPYATCKFGPPRIVFASYAPQINCHLCISQQPPLDLSLVSKKRYPSVFFRSLPGPTHSGKHFCFTKHLRASRNPPPTPPPIHRMERIHFSAALHSSSLRSVLHYHYSILRSSFFVLLFSESQKRTLITPVLPPSPCRTVFHSCVRACGWRYGLVWVQTVWINRLLTFFLSPVLYYLHITGDSVY